jgi:hypothetical protein
MLKRKKLLIVLAVAIALAIVIGGVGWVLTNSNPTSPPELSIQEQVREAAMAYTKGNHPETAQFMNDLAWTGGRVTPTGLVGAETYTYLSQGWNVTISYPVVPNPRYTIKADYSATSTGGASIPYRVIWQGFWEEGAVVETNYIFAQ